MLAAVFAAPEDVQLKTLALAIPTVASASGYLSGGGHSKKLAVEDTLYGPVDIAFSA